MKDAQKHIWDNVASYVKCKLRTLLICAALITTGALLGCGSEKPVDVSAEVAVPTATKPKVPVAAADSLPIEPDNENKPITGKTQNCDAIKAQKREAQKQRRNELKTQKRKAIRDAVRARLENPAPVQKAVPLSEVDEKIVSGLHPQQQFVTRQVLQGNRRERIVDISPTSFINSGRKMSYLWKVDNGVYSKGGTLRVNVNGINWTLRDDELELQTKSKQYKGQVPFIQQKNTVKFMSDTPGTKFLTIVQRRKGTQLSQGSQAWQELCRLTLENQAASTCEFEADEANSVRYRLQGTFSKPPKLSMTVNGHTHSILHIGSTAIITNASISFLQEQNKLTFTTETPGTHSIVVTQGGKEVCNLTLEDKKSSSCEFEANTTPTYLFEDYKLPLNGRYTTLSKDKAVALITSQFAEPSYLLGIDGPCKVAEDGAEENIRIWPPSFQMQDGEKAYQTKPLKVLRLSSLPHIPQTSPRDPKDDTEILLLISPGAQDLEPINTEGDILGILMIRSGGKSYIISEINSKRFLRRIL